MRRLPVFGLLLPDPTSEQLVAGENRMLSSEPLIFGVRVASHRGLPASVCSVVADIHGEITHFGLSHWFIHGYPHLVPMSAIAITGKFFVLNDRGFGLSRFPVLRTWSIGISSYGTICIAPEQHLPIGTIEYRRAGIVISNDGERGRLIGVEWNPINHRMCGIRIGMTKGMRPSTLVAPISAVGTVVEGYIYLSESFGHS